MSSNINSITPFLGGTVAEIIESIGITQFPSATEWYQGIGGLVVQGGLVQVLGGATLLVPFNAPHEKQVLGVWTQVVGAIDNNGYVNAVGLASFEIVNGAGARSYYWLSLGV